MYHLLLIILLAPVGEIYSMNRRSLDLTPGKPEGDCMPFRSSSPTRSCSLCKLAVKQYRKEIKKQTDTSTDIKTQEYALACLFHRLGKNEFASEDTQKLTVLQWTLFKNVSNTIYDGDTEKTLKTLRETYHCPKVDDQAEAHRQECVERATQLLLEARKLATIKAH